MTAIALIIGAGSGLSASLARLFAKEGITVALAARQIDKLAGLAEEIGALRFTADASQPDQVEQLFNQVEQQLGIPTIVIYNPSARVRGAIVDLDPVEVLRTLEVTAYGGFLVAQAATKGFLKVGEGAIFFTGASASVKGYALSAPFAMGKFALRGLAQSLARELAPQNIHVAHFIIDGGIRSERRPGPGRAAGRRGRLHRLGQAVACRHLHGPGRPATGPGTRHPRGAAGEEGPEPVLGRCGDGHEHSGLRPAQGAGSRFCAGWWPGLNLIPLGFRPAEAPPIRGIVPA